MTHYYIGADKCGMGEGRAIQTIANELRKLGHKCDVGSVSPNQEGASYSVSKKKVFLFLCCGVASATIWSFKNAIAAGSSPKTIFLHSGWTSREKNSPMSSEQNMLNCKFVPEFDAGQFMSSSSTAAMKRDAGSAKTVGEYCQKYSDYVGVAWAASPKEMAQKIANGETTGFGGGMSNGSATQSSNGANGSTSNISPLLQGEMTFEELVGEICNGIDLLFLTKKSVIVVNDFESIFAEAKYLRDKKSKAVRSEDINLWQLEEDSYELQVNQRGFYNTVIVKYKGGQVEESYDEYVRVYGRLPITYNDPTIDKTTAIMKAKAYLAAHVRDFNMEINLNMLTEPDIDIGDIVTVDNPKTYNNYKRKLRKKDPEYLFVNGIATSWEGDSLLQTDLNLKLAPVSPQKLEVPTSGTSTGSASQSGSNGASGMVFDSCGVSQDKQYVLSIAKPSAGRGGYSYNNFYATIFKNVCPRCNRKGVLRYDAGIAGAARCITCGGYSGSKSSWGDISESEVSCNGCCSDFCGVTGYEKDGAFSSRLTTYRKPVKTNSLERRKLMKGNYSL